MCALQYYYYQYCWMKNTGASWTALVDIWNFLHFIKLGCLSMLSVSITTNITSLNPANDEVYSIQRWNLPLTCDWSVVFFGYSGFLHQWILRRYARCWWHLTLHIIDMEKNVSRLLFHFFFFLICVCISWVWLGWRWCGCVLMYCSLFLNFTFCFYWFLFCFGLLVYICVVGVFV